MNNIQFENQFEITKKLVKSWNRLSQRRSAKHRLWLNFFAKIGIAVLAVLMFFFVRFSGSELSIVVFALLVFLFIFYLIWPAVTFNLQSKQFSGVTGEAKWIQTICFGEDIKIKNGNTTTTYFYDKIRFVDENDECFYLFISTGSRLSIFYIYKNSFSVGSAEEFSAFIKEKATEQEPLWTKRELNKHVLKKLRSKIVFWISFAVVVSLYFVLAEVVGVITFNNAGVTTFDKVRIGDKVYSTNITTLDLSGKNLNDFDIEQLRHMRNLVRLDLADNQISDIRPIEELTDLTWLFLTENKISDISALRGLMNLMELDLSENQISDIDALDGLNRLTNLAATDNQISDITALKGLSRLTVLNLRENQITNIDALAHLPKLMQLSLADNPIGDIDALKDLNKLTVLHLWNSHISDINALGGLTNLLKLDLRYNQISEAQMEEIRLALPNCDIQY